MTAGLLMSHRVWGHEQVLSLMVGGSMALAGRISPEQLTTFVLYVGEAPEPVSPRLETHLLDLRFRSFCSHSVSLVISAQLVLRAFCSIQLMRVRSSLCGHFIIAFLYCGNRGGKDSNICSESLSANCIEDHL